jgi:ppGpp synthetase/RelA/SpoT-type nucleotidyltranferase
MRSLLDPFKIDRDQFLRNYNLADGQVRDAGLDWSVLEQICDRHIATSEELQTTATYISQRLQSLPSVHSINVRIKDPEHLIAKIIRKKLEYPDLVFDLTSYGERITDLIGIRALHLFKDEWRLIHDFVTSTWELHENPIAYVRAGDPEVLIGNLASAGFDVKQHPFGYRSIHYVIKSRPARCTQLAELQVRTIFEEGWSEIDHRVRYPRRSDDPRLAEFLTIFNRLAGSADEMGTFIKTLSVYIREQSEKLAEREQLIAKQEDELKAAISELKISQEEKTNLERQVASLRRSSSPSASVSIFSSNVPTLSPGAASVLSSVLVPSPNVVSVLYDVLNPSPGGAVCIVSGVLNPPPGGAVCISSGVLNPSPGIVVSGASDVSLPRRLKGRPDSG